MAHSEDRLELLEKRIVELGMNPAITGITWIFAVTALAPLALVLALSALLCTSPVWITSATLFLTLVPLALATSKIAGHRRCGETRWCANLTATVAKSF